MMSMFRKFSQLLRTRACVVLFTICLISPLFVISASAVNVSFRSADGSEVYANAMFADAFISAYIEQEVESQITTEIVYSDYSDVFEVYAEDNILGWSYSPNQGVPDFFVGTSYSDSDIDYGDLNLNDEVLPLYLVLQGNAPPVEPEPEPEFLPLARPSGWIDVGTYNVGGYANGVFYGDTSVDLGNFPASYPSSMPSVSLGSNYSSFRPYVSLSFNKDIRNVYYNILVRQAWYFDGQVPSSAVVENVGLDGTVTVENALSVGGTTMYSLNSFENNVNCTASIDWDKGIIYFDYNISVFIPDTVPEPAHSGHQITFTFKHKNSVSGLNIIDQSTYVNVVSVYGSVATFDASSVRQYEIYRDKSNQQMQEGEAVIKDLESLVKPDPDQITPDKIIPDFIPTVDPSSGIEDVLTPVFQNAIILQLCSMVLGFAFVSYVLFGKKG